ncbi:MAG TPA: hypothetical protein VGO93_07075 [Candidatus Xenobia bacterium]|jgi:hypothetical protein
MTPKADRLDTFGREPAFEGAEIATVRQVGGLAQRMLEGAGRAGTTVMRLLDLAVVVTMAVDLCGYRLPQLTGPGRALMHPFSFLPVSAVGAGHMDWSGLAALALLLGVEYLARWAVGAVRSKS